MPTYTREQLDNIRKIKQTDAYRRASPRERKALFLATRVESNHQDLNYGDRDSLGILQQRNNGAWGAAKEDVATDAEQFLKVARAKNNQGGSAGQLAQRVQVSAFPDRYDEHSAEGDALIRGDNNGTSSRAVVKATAQTVNKPGTAPVLIPGGKSTDTKGAVVAALLDKRKGVSLAKRITENVSSGAFTTETEAEVKPGTAGTYDVAKVPGKKQSPKDDAPSSSNKGGQIAELFWNGPGARNVKDGVPQKKGFVSGHDTHVHVALKTREAMERAAKLARSMGLNVGEYGKGISSGHAPTSNHYKPYGAMDVTGARLSEFAKRIASGDF